MNVDGVCWTFMVTKLVVCLFKYVPCTFTFHSYIWLWGLCWVDSFPKAQVYLGSLEFWLSPNMLIVFNYTSVVLCTLFPLPVSSYVWQFICLCIFANRSCLIRDFVRSCLEIWISIKPHFQHFLKDFLYLPSKANQIYMWLLFGSKKMPPVEMSKC